MSNRLIPVAHPSFLGNEKTYVNDCLDTEWISSIGKYVSLFEQKFARYCGVDYGIACSSGTAALHLALEALGVKEGDEVLVPDMTYIATANAVRYCNATPVFVDSEPRSFNINPALIHEKITPRTKAIIAVHLYGHPADMDAINSIARQYGLFVVEDAAQAHGATYKGARAGSLSDIATFSFFGNKIITTGEGGMVTTRDPVLADLVRLLKGQGMDPKRRYWFPVVGYNYRMTNIQAALGLAQLENIAEHLALRWRVAETYNKQLSICSDLLTLPNNSPEVQHAFWMYTVLLPEGLDRDATAAALLDEGIETRPAFYPLHLMPPYRERSGGRYPQADLIGRRGLSLPMHGKLTDDDLDFVSKKVHSVATRLVAATR